MKCPTCDGFGHDDAEDWFKSPCPRCGGAGKIRAPGRPRGPAPRPEAERFWEKVDKCGPVPEHRPDLGPCWVWTASLGRGGYARFSTGGRIDTATAPSHRVAYEWLVGPIPAGLQIDHLCRNRTCVNPAHLEPVTRRENLLRGMSPMAQDARRTHCRNGHPYDAVNTRREPNGWRCCRMCQRDRMRRKRAARRLAA